MDEIIKIQQGHGKGKTFKEKKDDIISEIIYKYNENKTYILFLIISFFLGYIIHHTDKDLSKNTGFIFSSYKSSMPFIHILIGILVGICLYPREYKIENQDYEKIFIEKYGSVVGNIFYRIVKHRGWIGFIIYILFTIRNFIKHPYNLKKHLKKCKINANIILYSSISRQQIHILMGILISIIYFKDNPNHKLHDRRTILLNLIIFITTVQGIIKILISKKNTYIEF